MMKALYRDEGIRQLVFRNLSIRVDVKYRKNMIYFLLGDLGSEFEIINELAKLRIVNVIVVILVIFLKDIVHCPLHNFLYRLRSSAPIHRRIKTISKINQSTFICSHKKRTLTGNFTKMHLIFFLLPLSY